MSSTFTKEKNDTEDLDSRIFVRGHFTDFENLLFAKNEIKELKLEIGQSKSYIQELEHKINLLGGLQKDTGKYTREQLLSQNKKLRTEIEVLRNKTREKPYEQLHAEWLKSQGNIELIKNREISDWKTKHAATQIKNDQLQKEIEFLKNGETINLALLKYK